MKKVLSLVLCVVLVLGMMPVFAAGETGAQMLYKDGFISGDNGNLMVDKTLTRAEMAVLIAELNGLKDEAMNYAAPANFSDVAAGSWYAPYVAYGQANGWFAGYPDGSYKPEGTVTAQEFAAVMMNALGYNGDYTWNNVTAFAASKNVNVSSSSVGMLRGEAFEAMWGAVNQPAKGDTVSLGVKLGRIEAPVVAPTELAVTSVTATDLSRVMVTFNQAPDKDLATDETNYTIDGVTVDSAELDGNVVTLTLDPSVPVLTQDTDYTLDINSDLVDASVDFTAIDQSLPVAQSIKLTGPDTMEVTYSEPIAATSNITVEIEDGIYGATAVADNSNVVDVTLSASSLDAGTYKVVVSGAEDFAGYTALRKTFSLNYVEDKTAPVPTLVSADQTEVVIDFGKNVTDGNGDSLNWYLDSTNTQVGTTADLLKYFYHSYSSYNPDSVTVDGSEVTLDFTSNPLPEGAVKIVVNAEGTDNTGTITDLWGNEMAADATFTANITVDNTKPVVNKIDVVDESTVDVYFSEGMDITAANSGRATNPDNYVVKDSDGNEMSLLSVTYDSDNNYAELNFADTLDGNYTVEVSGVTDDSLALNKIVAKTFAFTVTDSTGLTSTDITANFIDGTSSDTIIVRFGDDMSSAATNKATYLYKGLDGKWATLGSKDTVAFFGGNDAVKITLADETLCTGTIDLQVAGIQDSNGNDADQLSYQINGIGAPAAPAITSMEMTGYKTIDLTYANAVITNVSASGYSISKDNGATWTTAAAVSVAKDGDDSIVTLTLRSDAQLASDATAFTTGQVYKVSTLADKVKADTGMYAVANVDSGVTDGIAPTIDPDSVVFTVTNTGTVAAPVYTHSIKFEISEDLSNDFTTLYATDFVVNYDGDSLVAGASKDYTLALSSAVVSGVTHYYGTITINGYATTHVSNVKFGTVDAPQYAQDTAGNTVEALAVDSYSTN